MKPNLKGLKLAQKKLRIGEPPQYPQITDPMEKAVKNSFNSTVNNMYADLTKIMVEFKKQNNV